MPSPITNTIKTKLGQDLLWNYLSLGILAVSGILINVIIAGVYGAATLGVFNQAYAVYIIASQFAVGGIQFSVLKHVAEFAEDKNKRNQIVSSAVVLSLLFGVITGTVVYFLKNIFGNLLGSVEVTKSLVFVAPALVFFSLNKVLILALNGLRRMKAFALAQASRYFFMVTFIVVASVSDLPGHTLAATFLVSESVLFMILLILINSSFSFVHWIHWDDWLRTHVVFGFKGFMSGILVEMNTRVDVLMLGFFLSDQAVGIYAFAAMLAEGLYQSLIVIRNNIDPILVRLLLEGKFVEIKSMIRKTQKILYPAMAVVVLVVVGLFPYGVELLKVDTAFMQSWPVLAILATGIFISSGYVPFDGIMIQAGLPEYHTMIKVLAVSSNIVLNAAMIPVWGIIGAAIATSSSFVLAVFYLNIVVKKQLKFNLR